MNILLATGNPHKLEEIQAVFDELDPQRSLGIHLVSLNQRGLDIPEPVEDQATFEANAALKARHYAQAAQMPCLADDSGLEVDALGGEPGVRSARYAGVTGPRGVVDPANNRLLLERLRDVPAERRTARFVCAMALVVPGRPGPLVGVRGTIEGRIIGPDESPRGSHGFGYDPLFVIPALGRTTAELPAAEKNAISHRGRATRLMFEQLRQLAPANLL